MFGQIFTWICIAGTIVSMFHCLQNYFKDGDVSKIEFKQFNQDEDGIAPSISLCFKDLFINKRLEEFGEGINSKMYRSFLQGKTHDNRMAKIDYDNVTIDINEYLDRIKLFTADGKVHIQHGKLTKIPYINSTSKRFVEGYVGWRSSISKCYTFDVPFIEGIEIISLGIAFKKKIFSINKTPSWGVSTARQDAGFYVTFHYPGQIYRATQAKYNWNPRILTEYFAFHQPSYEMQFKLSGLEATKRRNHGTKGKLNCLNEWRDYDNAMIKHAIQKSNCKPYYWANHGKDVEYCKDFEDYTNVKNELDAIKTGRSTLPSPCGLLERFTLNYEEMELRKSRSKKDEFSVTNSAEFISNDTVWVTVHFVENGYKLIKQVSVFINAYEKT